MLDEMAIQLNQEQSNHKEALSDLKLQHGKEVRHTHTCLPFNSSAHCFYHVLHISSPNIKKQCQHRVNLIIKNFL